MKFIAHRGNINGPNPPLENRLEQISLAIKHGFDVEIDVRLHEGHLYLGHDTMQEEVSTAYLHSNKSNLWIHAKDMGTFLFLLKEESSLNVFCHDVDDAVFTNKGYLWTHPRHEVFIPTSVALKFEYKPGFIVTHSGVHGICTDNPYDYRKEYYEEVLQLKQHLEESWDIPCSFSGCTKLADTYRCPWGDFAHCTEHDDQMTNEYVEYYKEHESDRSGVSDILEPGPVDRNLK